MPLDNRSAPAQDLRMWEAFLVEKTAGSSCETFTSIALDEFESQVVLSFWSSEAFLSCECLQFLRSQLQYKSHDTSTVHCKMNQNGILTKLTL